MNKLAGSLATSALGPISILFAVLSVACGGGGGGSDNGGDVLTALSNSANPATTAVDRTPPDPETRAVLGEVASAALGFATASSVLATEANDRAPHGPLDLGETVFDNAPIVRLADDLRDRIKVFSLASDSDVHSSVIDVPLFEWVYDEDQERWRVEYDDDLFNNFKIRAKIFDLVDDGTVDENGDPVRVYVPTKHYGSTTTERIVVDIDVDWFPSLSQFAVDGTFTFDGFDTNDDLIFINGKADIEIWDTFDGEISLTDFTIDRGDLWDLRYPVDGVLYMDLMGFAEITATIEDEDRVELYFEFFGIDTLRFGVNLDYLFPDEFAIEL
jgi:hypothetical protein